MTSQHRPVRALPVSARTSRSDRHQTAAAQNRGVRREHTRRARDVVRLPSEGDELWVEFWLSRTPEARNTLVELHLGIVDDVVRRLPHNVLQHWAIDDLRSFGVFGLISAVERRQESMAHLAFSTYASQRIRGAIYDELRRLDWLPRSARRDVIDFARAEEDLRYSLRRTPMHEEALAAMGPRSPGRALGVSIAICRSQVGSLEARRGSDQDPGGARQLAATTDVEAELLHNIDHADLNGAIALLPDRSRSILTYRYIDDLTQQQVGKILGVTNSRISQLEHAALKRLRTMLTIEGAA